MLSSSRGSLVPFLLLLIVIATATAAAVEVEYELYTLPNGLTVILHEDHNLPQVSVNTWFYVGSKDDPPGRSGFAHLFEHLMFMGSMRVPGSGYDDLMEAGGGANNASTGSDRTNYLVWGPSSLLPTLLWLDADRLDGLGQAMTQEKLDLQRDVVLNERRENYENSPYAKAYLIIPKAIYPADHPYHESGIGEPEDLEAATLDDVTGFFDTFYVPGNASLVVAGDFDSVQVKEIIGATFGAVSVRPMPEHRTAPPVALTKEIRRVDSDRVESPRLYLVWPSPAIYAPGDAEMDLVAGILADGPSSRLHQRLVMDERVARSVEAYQASEGLGSLFHIEVTATEGGDLEQIKRAVLEVMEEFKTSGPTAAELQRVKAAQEAYFLRSMENLIHRADSLNEYRYYFGEPDSFQRDLERWTLASAEDVQGWAQKVFTDGRLDLRILPEDASVEDADLDKRPEAFPVAAYSPPVPDSFTLDNGVEVALVSRPGSGLFSGALVVDGGERLVSADRAGLASLTATLLTSGAGGRSASEYADAVASLGGDVRTSVSWHDLIINVRGLTSRLDSTLDLFADAVLRPNFAIDDFQRERDLAIEGIRATAQNPNAVAFLTGRSMVYGADDPRGRPSSGVESTVAAIEIDDIRAIHPKLVAPQSAQFVFVGDVDVATLKTALEKRFGNWSEGGDSAPTTPAGLTENTGRMAMVDRPGAPQTVIYLMRPVPGPADSVDRATRSCVNSLFGSTFTSRLMRNLREEHGYTYGAASRFYQRGDQYELFAYSAVQGEVTGAALAEFKKEFDRLASGDISSEELQKSLKTVRYDLTNTAESTSSMASTLVSLASDGRPLDDVATAFASLEEVDLEGSNALARSGLFDWDTLSIMLVGDAETVIPQLEEFGFPAPEIVDMAGRPVAP